MTRELPNIVFFGSDAICLPALNYLTTEAADLCHLCAVISSPDRPQGRGRKRQSNPVVAWAIQHGIRTLQPEKPDRELALWLLQREVVASLVMAYGHFLGKALREAASNGMVNFHGSILPQYRGASPVETAIAMGDRETGVSLMEVTGEIDAGGVADLEKVLIEKSDTAPDVRAAIAEAVLPLLRRNLPRLLEQPLHFKPQEASRATFCRKILREDGAIDFHLPAEALHCRLRAFTPWPGGYFQHQGQRIKVGQSEVVPSPSGSLPGSVLDCSSGLTVATSKGALRFLELQRPGGCMLPAADFLNGCPLPLGTQLKGGSARPLVQ